jgi:hypothetical protein
LSLRRESKKLEESNAVVTTTRKAKKKVFENPIKSLASVSKKELELKKTYSIPFFDIGDNGFSSEL